MKDKDYILKAPMMGLLLKLSYPLVLSNIVATLYSLADGVWLAQLSAKQFTATSFTWPIIFLFVSVAIGISIAGTSLISRAIGAQDRERASDYAKHLIIMSSLVGVFFSILGYIVSPILVNYMGARGELYELSVIYLKVHAIGFVIDTLYFSFQAILNAQGRTKETTIMGIVSGLLNIILDPIFIFTTIPFVGVKGFGWGVFGAAFATLLAKLIALFIGVFKTYKDKTYLDISLRDFIYKRKIVNNIARMAFPTAVGRSSAALGFTVLNAFIISYGENVVAAFSVVNRITEFFMQISMGVGAAMTSIIGQNLGARDFNRVKVAIKDAKIITWITSLSGMLLLFLFSNQILSIFIDISKNEEIFDIALEYLKIDIFMVPLIGLFNIYQSLFQGTGKMKYSMHMSTGRLWVIRIPLILLFKNFTDIGRIGIWIAMLLSNILIILYCLYIFKTKDIIEDRYV